MMGYESGGVKKDFLTDHLGSITAEIDQNQNRTFETRYSAFGRNNWSTGTGCGFGWVGSFGYRETGLFHMSHYVRARHYSNVTGGWSTVDPLWPDESAYGYVGGRSTGVTDPSGQASIPCKPFMNCLRAHSKSRCECVGGGKDPGLSIEKALCVFWQETSLGTQVGGSPPGGVGSCTQACFEELRRKGCSWLDKFKNYDDFKRNATPCDKASAGWDFMALVGLPKYGPGKGRPGNYEGGLLDRINKCEQCMKDARESGEFCHGLFPGVPLPDPDGYCKSCFGIIHG
jgi:RHS repeat-associated protein